MKGADRLTVEEFADRLPDLGDGGRWVELDAGEVVQHDPPDDQHGLILLNLSRTLGAYLEERSEPPGFAYFELGIVIARGPDTVRCPAVSFFSGGTPFAEADRRVSPNMPRWVVEIASSNSRRRTMRERVLEYHRAGVDLVWVIDPQDQLVLAIRRNSAARSHSVGDSVGSMPVLTDFRVPVGSLFIEPEWWAGRAKPEKG